MGKGRKETKEAGIGQFLISGDKHSVAVESVTTNDVIKSFKVTILL